MIMCLRSIIAAWIRQVSILLLCLNLICCSMQVSIPVHDVKCVLACIVHVVMRLHTTCLCTISTWYGMSLYNTCLCTTITWYSLHWIHTCLTYCLHHCGGYTIGFKLVHCIHLHQVCTCARLQKHILTAHVFKLVYWMSYYLCGSLVYILVTNCTCWRLYNTARVHMALSWDVQFGGKASQGRVWRTCLWKTQNNP